MTGPKIVQASLYFFFLRRGRGNGGRYLGLLDIVSLLFFGFGVVAEGDMGAIDVVECGGENSLGLVHGDLGIRNATEMMFNPGVRDAAVAGGELLGEGIFTKCGHDDSPF